MQRLSLVRWSIRCLGRSTCLSRMPSIFLLTFIRSRHGLVFPWGSQPPPSAPGKDMYLIPLKPSSSLPEFIELLDRAPSVPKRREQDVILGVYVLTKGKLVVPPPTPPVPAATPVPAAPPPAVANLIQSQGGISSLLSSVFGSLPPQPSPPQPIPTFAPPPQPVQMQPPPTATLAALSSDLQNLTPEQINLILQGLAGKATLPPPVPPAQGWPAPYPGAAPQSYPPAIPSSNAAYPPHGQSPLGRSPLQHTYVLSPHKQLHVLMHPLSIVFTRTVQGACTPISDRTLVRPPAARETGTGTGTGTVCHLEGRGVVVITTGTAEMIAGVAASGRETRAGPRGEDPVLPLAVSERFFGIGFSSLDISRLFS
jgi:hypothetical protein